MINVTVDKSLMEVANDLKKLGIDIKKSLPTIVQSLATAGRAWVRSHMTNIRTGWLKRHVYGYRRSETHAVVAAPRFRAEKLEVGGEIVPRRKKYLSFAVPGGGARVKSVTMPQTRWFSRAIAGFDTSPEYDAAVDKGVKKAVDKFLGAR